MGEFEADWVGFMVYDDGDRLPLGQPHRCHLSANAFTVYWPAKRAHREGDAIGIAVVLPDGSVSLMAIDRVHIEVGGMFHGSMSITLPNTLEWHDRKLAAIDG